MSEKGLMESRVERERTHILIGISYHIDESRDILRPKKTCQDSFVTQSNDREIYEKF